MQICLELPTSLPDRSWLAIACFLVDHGADLDCVDMRGNTPVSHIKSEAVLDLLRKRARSASSVTVTWNYFHGSHASWKVHESSGIFPNFQRPAKFLNLLHFKFDKLALCFACVCIKLENDRRLLTYKYY